jgi:antitoxin CptB
MDDPRLKRLIFRAHHMGSNENDLLFGGFAERYLAGLTAEQVDRFEILLAENDNDLFNWITGKEQPPASFDHDVMALIRRYVQTEASRS